jgi:hypothetical protein
MAAAVVAERHSIVAAVVTELRTVDSASSHAGRGSAEQQNRATHQRHTSLADPDRNMKALPQLNPLGIPSHQRRDDNHAWASCQEMKPTPERVLQHAEPVENFYQVSSPF